MDFHILNLFRNNFNMKSLLYRRQPKYTEEMPDDSVKYRIEYENNGLLINDKLFQRQLFRTQTESVIDTISILNRISNSSSNRLQQINPIKSSEVKQSTKYLIQKNNLVSSIEKNSLNDDLLIVPNWSLSICNRTKNETPESETQSTDDSTTSTKRFNQSIKRKQSKTKLRNLLDNGVFNEMNKKSNSFVITDNTAGLLFLTKLNKEKQLKQVDTYRKFKAELGFSFSRRLPNISIQSAPSFFIRPLGNRFNCRN